MLEAISIQALAQATLSVKRRLAYEQVSYFSQAHYCLLGCDTSDSYGKKLLLFLKWKCMEAKAVAYCYHGLVLDKGGEPANHISAQKDLLEFLLWLILSQGLILHYYSNIATSTSEMANFTVGSTLQSVPDLPEFALSLRPEGYELPSTDSIWENVNGQPQIQSLKAHLTDGEDEVDSK
ncbi:uncharacterized protein [Miscanthus floridulus]|uniref:uncharacterized protein n=1 Tax=Miscanthus floridulus TaxID=154761 RepID=UPI00345B27CE